MDVRARVPAFKPPGKDELTRALREVADFRAPGQYVLHDWLAPQAAELAAAAVVPPAPAAGPAADAAAARRAGPAAAGARGTARAAVGKDGPARQGGGAARAAGEVGPRGSPASGGEAGSPGAGAARRAGGAARRPKPSDGHERAPGGDGVGRGAIAGEPAPTADAAAAVRAGDPAAAAVQEKKEKKRKRLVHAGEDGVPPPAPLPRRSPDEQAGRPAAEGEHRGPAAGAPASEAAARPGTSAGHGVVASGAAGHRAPPLAAGAAGSGGAAAEAPGHPAPAPGAAPGGAPEPPGLRSSLSASSGDYDTTWFAPHEGRPPAAYAPAASESQCDAYVREYGAKHAVYFRLHQEIEATRRCGGPLRAGVKLSCDGGMVSQAVPCLRPGLGSRAMRGPQVLHNF